MDGAILLLELGLNARFAFWQVLVLWEPLAGFLDFVLQQIDKLKGNINICMLTIKYIHKRKWSQKSTPEKKWEKFEEDDWLVGPTRQMLTA